MKPDGKRVECRKGIRVGKNWVQFLALPVLRHIHTYLSTLCFIFIRSRDPWAFDLWLAWPWLQTFLGLFNSSFLYHVRLIPSLYLQLLFSGNFNPVSFTFSLHIFLIKLWRYWSGRSSPTVGIVFRGVKCPTEADFCKERLSKCLLVFWRISDSEVWGKEIIYPSSLF